MLLFLAKDLFPECMVVLREADHLLGSFIEAAYMGNLLLVFLREKVPGGRQCQSVSQWVMY